MTANGSTISDADRSDSGGTTSPPLSTSIQPISTLAPDADRVGRHFLATNFRSLYPLTDGLSQCLSELLSSPAIVDQISDGQRLRWLRMPNRFDAVEELLNHAANPHTTALQSALLRFVEAHRELRVHLASYDPEADAPPAPQAPPGETRGPPARKPSSDPQQYQQQAFAAEHRGKVAEDAKDLEGAIHHQIDAARWWRKADNEKNALGRDGKVAELRSRATFAKGDLEVAAVFREEAAKAWQMHGSDRPAAEHRAFAAEYRATNAHKKNDLPKAVASQQDAARLWREAGNEKNALGRDGEAASLRATLALRQGRHVEAAELRDASGRAWRAHGLDRHAAKEEAQGQVYLAMVAERKGDLVSAIVHQSEAARLWRKGAMAPHKPGTKPPRNTPEAHACGREACVASFRARLAISHGDLRAAVKYNIEAASKWRMHDSEDAAMKHEAYAWDLRSSIASQGGDPSEAARCAEELAACWYRAGDLRHATRARGYALFLRSVAFGASAEFGAASIMADDAVGLLLGSGSVREQLVICYAEALRTLILGKRDIAAGCFEDTLVSEKQLDIQRNEPTLRRVCVSLAASCRQPSLWSRLWIVVMPYLGSWGANFTN